MIPREKAIDLAQKFEGLTAKPFDGTGNIRLNESARQRAIVCCDEIIEHYHAINDKRNDDAKGPIYFWQLVKIEISKL